MFPVVLPILISEIGQNVPTPAAPEPNHAAWILAALGGASFWLIGFIGVAFALMFLPNLFTHEGGPQTH